MLIDEIKNEVYTLLKNDRTGHNIDHIERVMQLAKIISIDEKIHFEKIALIVLLHDVDDYKLFPDSTNNQNARRILSQYQLEDESIIQAINEIGYSKRLKGIEATSIEAKIVSDSDMLDSIGSNGILRAYQYSLSKNQVFFNSDLLPNQEVNFKSYTTKTSTTVNHMFEKLLRIKDYMYTNKGKQLAMQRHQIMIQFLDQFFIEVNEDNWRKKLDVYR